MPFTRDQFFGVFATYNEQFAIVAVLLWIIGVLAVLAARKRPEAGGRLVTGYLGLLWLWNAAAYHAFLFTAINPAAWLFAALFAMQGVLLLMLSARPDVRVLSAAGWRNRAGIALIVYGFAYPLLSVLSGHAYPAAPTFGVPCPTALVTAGVLITMSGRVVAALSVMPVLWAFIGGSAALFLGVWPDYALLVAAVLLTAAATGEVRRGGPAPG